MRIEAPLPPDRVAAAFAVADRVLRDRYGNRPGFDLRTDLAWPRDDGQERQTNAFIGPRAGLEVAWRPGRSTGEGSLEVRERGWIELRLKARAILVGAVVGLAALAFLAVDGLVWNRFIAYSYRAYGQIFHGGAFVLYAVVPAVVIGFAAGAVVWLSSWLVRPLVRAANRALGVESPAHLLARIVGDSTRATRIPGGP